MNSMFLWRISNHLDLSGKGALIAPARWHSGVLPVVYLAETPTGALLEHLVHLVSGHGKLPRTFSLLKISIPENFVVHELSPLETQNSTDSSVAVEKLLLGELAKNSSRQDALQAIFSDRVGIFYHRILGRL